MVTKQEVIGYYANLRENNVCPQVVYCVLKDFEETEGGLKDMVAAFFGEQKYLSLEDVKKKTG